jgi:glutamate-5-semialdehyde dehydrogenase
VIEVLAKGDVEMSSSVRRVTDQALTRGVEPEIRSDLAALGRGARAAARKVALATAQEKDAALLAMAASLRERMPLILAANALDMEEAKRQAATEAFLDRLRLDEARGLAIAQAVEEIATLADPVGRITARFERPNGLVIERVATPLGVVGVIFESRPNVMADARFASRRATPRSCVRARRASAPPRRSMRPWLRASSGWDCRARRSPLSRRVTVARSAPCFPASKA